MTATHPLNPANTMPTTPKPHPLIGEPPTTETPAQQREARDDFDRRETKFYAEHKEQLWLAHQAGAKLRKIDGEFALVIKPPREGLEFLARHEQDEHVGQRLGCVGDGVWSDMLGDLGPGWPELPTRPTLPNLAQLIEEMKAVGEPHTSALVAFAIDDCGGLEVHSLLDEKPTHDLHIRRALDGRGWSEVDAVSKEAVYQYRRDHSTRNDVILGLGHEPLRARWCASMRDRVEVRDAEALGGVRKDDDTSLIRWVLAPGQPARLHLALASLAHARNA